MPLKYFTPTLDKEPLFYLPVIPPVNQMQKGKEILKNPFAFDLPILFQRFSYRSTYSHCSSCKAYEALRRLPLTDG